MDVGREICRNEAVLFFIGWGKKRQEKIEAKKKGPARNRTGIYGR